MSEAYLDAALTPEERAEALLEELSLEEKIAQVRGVWGIRAEMWQAQGEAFRQFVRDGIGQVSTLAERECRSLEEAVQVQKRCQDAVMAESPHHIPAVFHMEGLCGAFITGATSFPAGIGRGASFDPALERKIGGTVARQELASLEPSGVDDKVAFCLAHGAGFVETNMGSKAMFTGPAEKGIIQKSSGEAAELFRRTVMERYGCGRPFGYVYGGSGGGYKTMCCIEHSDCFDGAVPYVIGSPASLPNTICLHAQGQRTLRRVFGRIVDALDAGGSGNMYEGLTADEAAMLREITRLGFPPRAWYVEAMGVVDDGSLPVLIPGVRAADPEYFRDFWTVPGYAGADPDSNCVRDRLQFRSQVVSVHTLGQEDSGADDGPDTRNGVDTAWKKLLTKGVRNFLELEQVPPRDAYLKGCSIVVEDGEAAGSRMLLGRIEENFAVVGMCFGADHPEEILARIRPGDTVRLDNSDYIAIQSYYRYQVPDRSFHAWDQFRGTDGAPLTPQRASVMGFHMNGTGYPQNGNLQGRTIVLEALMDESSCPWCADWYRNKVIRTQGDDRNLRVYFMDHCMHGDETGLGNSRVVNYMGALRQALLDVADWVEKGREPLPDTNYQIEEGIVRVPDTAAERAGLQPVVQVTGENGKDYVRVRTGQQVAVVARAEVPAGQGEIVRMDLSWQDGDRLRDPEAFSENVSFRHVAPADGTSDAAAATAVHRYEKPGTYFVSCRVMSSRDPEDPYTRVQNLGRCRIIVE